MLAFETEDVLQAWALPMENIIGVGGFDLALAANPLTSGLVLLDISKVGGGAQSRARDVCEVRIRLRIWTERISHARRR